MPAHANPEHPQAELHIAGETETDFTFAIIIPKEWVVRHRRFFESLIEAATGEGRDDA